MTKSSQYKQNRRELYYIWSKNDMKKAPIRVNFPQLIINTTWQFVAWCIGLALSFSFVLYGLNGFLTGEIIKSSLFLMKITWLPFTIYTMYWGYRMIDIIIYDRINYPKYLKHFYKEHKK